MDSVADPASRGQWSFLVEPNQHTYTKRREIPVPTVMERLTTELLSKRTASSSGRLPPRVSDCRDYVDMVLTCEGDYYDPDFPCKLKCFNQKLQQILHADKEKLTIKKVEPWNSVKVTLNIPREAAVRLKALAEEGSEALRSIGVLAVQVEGDRVISMTFTGRDDQTTQVRFGSAPCHGTDHPLLAMSSPAVQQKSPVTTLLSGHFLKPKPLEMPVTTVRSSGGLELSQALSNGIPFACHPIIAPKLGAAPTAAIRPSGHVPAGSISGTLDAVVAAAVAMAPRSSLTCTARQPVSTKNIAPKAKRIRKKEPVPSCKPSVNSDVPLNSANADTKVVDRAEMVADGTIHLPPPCTARLAAGSDGMANVTLMPVGGGQNGCTMHANRSLLELGRGELVSANESIKAISDIITSLSAAPSHHVLVHHQTLRAGVNKNNNVHNTTQTILPSVTAAAAAFTPTCTSRSQTSAIVKDSSSRLGSSSDTLKGYGSGTAVSGGEVASHVEVTAAEREAEKATDLAPCFSPELGSGTVRNSNSIPMGQQLHTSSATEGICIAVAVQPDNKMVAVSLSHVPHVTANKTLVHSDNSDTGPPVVRNIECGTGKSARLLANCALQAAVSSHSSGLATGLAKAMNGSGTASSECLLPCTEAMGTAAVPVVQQVWSAHSAIGGGKLTQAFHHDAARERLSYDTRPIPVTASVGGPNQSLLVKRSMQSEQHAQHRSGVVTLTAATCTASIATASTSNTVIHSIDRQPIQTVELAASSAVETKAATDLSHQMDDGPTHHMDDGPTHHMDDGLASCEESFVVANSNDVHSGLSSIGAAGPAIAALMSSDTPPPCSMANGEDHHSPSTCPLGTGELGPFKCYPPSDLPPKYLSLKAQLECDPPATNGDRYSDPCLSLQSPWSSGTTPSGGDPVVGTVATRNSASDRDCHTPAAEQQQPLPEQNQFCGHAATISKADVSRTPSLPDSADLHACPMEYMHPISAQCVLPFATLPGSERRQSCTYAIGSPVSTRRCSHTLSNDEGNGHLEASPSDASTALCLTSETNGDRAAPDQEAPLDLSSPTRPVVQTSQLFHAVVDGGKDCMRVNGLISSTSVAVKLLPKLEDEHDPSVARGSCTTNGAASSPERGAHSLPGKCLQLPANSADARRASSESVESGISLDECSNEMTAVIKADGSSSLLTNSVTEQRGDVMEPDDSTVETADCSTVLLAAQPPVPVAVDRPAQHSTPGRGRPRSGTKRSYLLTIESNSAEVILGDAVMEASRLGISETDNGEPKAKGRRGRKVQECPKKGVLLSSMSAAHFEPAKRATRSHGVADLQALPTVYRERRKPLKDKK